MVRRWMASNGCLLMLKYLIKKNINVSGSVQAVCFSKIWMVNQPAKHYPTE